MPDSRGPSTGEERGRVYMYMYMPFTDNCVQVIIICTIIVDMCSKRNSVLFQNHYAHNIIHVPVYVF